jgi:RNA-binding protein 23/39
VCAREEQRVCVCKNGIK